MITLTALLWLAFVPVPKNPPCLNGWIDRMALLCPGQEFEQPNIRKKRKAKR